MRKNGRKERRIQGQFIGEFIGESVASEDLSSLATEEQESATKYYIYNIITVILGKETNGGAWWAACWSLLKCDPSLELAPVPPP